MFDCEFGTFSFGSPVTNYQIGLFDTSNHYTSYSFVLFQYKDDKALDEWSLIATNSKSIKKKTKPQASPVVNKKHFYLRDLELLVDSTFDLVKCYINNLKRVRCVLPSSVTMEDDNIDSAVEILRTQTILLNIIKDNNDADVLLTRLVK